MDLKIGEIYTFDYESTSKSKKSEKETVKVIMSEELAENLIDYIRENEVDTIERFEEQCKFTDEIKNTKNKELQDELKAEFRERYSSGGEQPDNIKAQYLFFRNYKPEGITLSDEGYVTAVFAGWNCTITGKVTYKWYVLSELNVPADKLTNGIMTYVEEVE